MVSAAVAGLYPSMQVSHLTYADLGRNDIRRITRLLSYVPAPCLPADGIIAQSYHRYTENYIHRLPSHLRNNAHGAVSHIFRGGFLGRAESLRSDGPNRQIASRKSLCPLHSPINRSIIDSLFNMIEYEITDAIPDFLKKLTAENLLLDTHAELFSVIFLIPQMWMSENQFTTLSARGIQRSKHWAPQPNGCSACILGRIGGSKDAVLALRSGMIARFQESRTLHACSARLWFVTSWLKYFEDSTWLLNESCKVGMEVKQMVKELRNRKSSRRPSSTTELTSIHNSHKSLGRNASKFMASGSIRTSTTSKSPQQDTQERNRTTGTLSYHSTDDDVGSLYDLFPELKENQDSIPSSTIAASDYSASIYSQPATLTVDVPAKLSTEDDWSPGDSMINRYLNNNDSKIEGLDDAYSRTYVNSTSSNYSQDEISETRNMHETVPDHRFTETKSKSGFESPISSTGVLSQATESTELHRRQKFWERAQSKVGYTAVQASFGNGDVPQQSKVTRHSKTDHGIPNKSKPRGKRGEKRTNVHQQIFFPFSNRQKGTQSRKTKSDKARGKDHEICTTVDRASTMRLTGATTWNALVNASPKQG